MAIVSLSMVKGKITSELTVCYSAFGTGTLNLLVSKKEMYEKANETFKKLKAEKSKVIVKLFDNEKLISGQSEHTGPAKHKVSIDLGLVKTTSRHRRQFSEQSSILPMKSSLDSRFNTQPLANERKPDVSTQKYQTDEGISVKVYKGNITNLPVGCMLNAANEDLWHGKGVGLLFQRQLDSILR